MPTRTGKSTTPRKPAELTLAHRLHALLHTVRHIAHVEDELCTLLHAAEHGETTAPELANDLRALLTRMPANDYIVDLEAVRSALAVRKAKRLTAAKKLSSKPRKPLRARAATKKAAKPKARKVKS